MCSESELSRSSFALQPHIHRLLVSPLPSSLIDLSTLLTCQIFILPCLLSLKHHIKRLKMDHPSFVFLNTTNAPGLSPQAARQMRCHITKSNFAKRRQRMERAPGVTKAKRANVMTSTGQCRNLLRRNGSDVVIAYPDEDSLAEIPTTTDFNQSNTWLRRTYPDVHLLGSSKFPPILFPLLSTF